MTEPVNGPKATAATSATSAAPTTPATAADLAKLTAAFSKNFQSKALQQTVSDTLAAYIAAFT